MSPRIYVWCAIYRWKFRRQHEISLRNFNKDKFKSIFKKFRQNFNFIKGDWRWRIARRRISWWGGRNWNGTLAGDSMSRKTIKWFWKVFESYVREDIHFSRVWINFTWSKIQFSRFYCCIIGSNNFETRELIRNRLNCISAYFHQHPVGKKVL